TMPEKVAGDWAAAVAYNASSTASRSRLMAVSKSGQANTSPSRAVFLHLSEPSRSPAAPGGLRSGPMLADGHRAANVRTVRKISRGVAVGPGAVPRPGRGDDLLQRGAARPPAQLGGRLRRVRHQHGRVAGAPRRLHHAQV